VYVTLAEFKAYFRMKHYGFSGTGANDISVSGITALTPARAFMIRIDGSSNPNTFKWSIDGGTTWAGTLVACTTTPKHLRDNIYIAFGAVTGHVVDDQFSFTTSDLTEDYTAQECLTDAQADFEDETNCVFEWSGEGTPRYYNHAYPPLSTSRPGRLWLDRRCYSVSEVLNGDGNVIPATGYVLEPENGPPYHSIILLGSEGYSWTFYTDIERAFKITAKWAYAAAAERGVKMAIIALAKFYLDVRQNRIHLKREDLSNEDWPERVKKAVRKYRFTPLE
jgi:hypothetical protein